MPCMYYKRRTMKKMPYCTLKREWTPVCQSCKDKQYKEIKSMKKKSPKLSKAEKERFSIITNDLTKCIENKDHTGHIDKHEVYRGRNRLNSIKYGMVIPLCRTCHDDPTIERKWQLIGQDIFVEKYGYDEFMKVFKLDYKERYKEVKE